MLKSNALLNWRTLSDGFTQSELTEMGRCVQKWNWRYNHLFEKAGAISFPLMVGSVLHDAMEQFYMSPTRVKVATLKFEEGAIPSLQDITDLEYWNHVLPRMIEAYMIYYRNDKDKWEIHSIEEEIDITFEGFRLRGKIDLTVGDPDGKFTVDHKSTSRLNKDIVAGWDFRFQFMFYLWLKQKKTYDPMLKGYYINAIKKPELRVKKNESVPEFAQRVFEDMVQEPDKYFYRDRYVISDAALKHFETTVVRHKLTKIRAVLNPSTPMDLAEALIQDKNTNECQPYNGAPCPYLELCRHGYEKMGFLYQTKPYKHAELDNEN
jgi:hypothetical protein